MTSHHKVRKDDPRRSSMLTDSTGRLPYASPARPLLSRAQSTAYVVLALLGMVLIFNIIALDVVLVFVFLNYSSLPLPFP